MRKKQIIPLVLLHTGVAFAAPTSPNIVIFFVDDLGWADLGYQNSLFHTPNIDKLKQDGAYFSRAYVSTATSSPSRASLLTGKEALRVGLVRHIYNNPNRDEFQVLDSDPARMKSRAWLPLEETTYAERLKEYGYSTCFIGKWHLGHEPFFPIHQGFDTMFGVTEYGQPNDYYTPFFKTNYPTFDNVPDGSYLTDILTDNAEEFIRGYDKDNPFLLNLWYYTVHAPHRGRKDLVLKYKNKGLKEDMAEYASMVEAMDESVGRIRLAIEEKGLSDNTLFVFISDQGGAFSNAPLRGGKKGGDTLAEGGSRVPMIIYYPGLKAMGTTITEPVQTIDIYPTLIELVSGKKCVEKQLNGVSLKTLLDGGTLKSRSLFLYRSYEDQYSAIIKGDWKLIRYRSGKVQLYNLKQDVGETNDLSLLEQTRAKAMEKELTEWEMKATPDCQKDSILPKFVTSRNGANLVFRQKGSKNGVLPPNHCTDFSASPHYCFRFTAMKKNIHRSVFVKKC